MTHTYCSFITAEIGRDPGRLQKFRSVLLKQGSKRTRVTIVDNLVKHKHRAWLLCPRGSGTHPASPWQPRQPCAAAQDTLHPKGFSRLRDSRAQNDPPAMLVALMSPGTLRAPQSAKATPHTTAGLQGHHYSDNIPHFKTVFSCRTARKRSLSCSLFLGFFLFGWFCTTHNSLQKKSSCQNCIPIPWLHQRQDPQQKVLLDVGSALLTHFPFFHFGRTRN